MTLLCLHGSFLLQDTVNISSYGTQGLSKLPLLLQHPHLPLLQTLLWYSCSTKLHATLLAGPPGGAPSGIPWVSTRLQTLSTPLSSKHLASFPRLPGSLPFCAPLLPCLRLLQCSLSTRHQLPRKQGLCYSPWRSQPLAPGLAQSRSSTSVPQSHSTSDEACTAVCTGDKARNRLEQVSAFEELTIRGERQIRNKQINEQVDASGKGSEDSQAERCN